MKKIIFTVLIIGSMSSFAQQDTQYNLYQFNQLSINPAYAGARDAIAAVIDVRKQWIGFGDGAPTTAVLAVHTPLLNNKLGVGINVISDQIGAKSVTAFYANFAYIAKLSNTFKLSFGARAGYSSYKFDFSKLSYKDGNEAALTDLANSNRGALDVDAGIYLKSSTFYVGFSATHLNSAILYEKKIQPAGSLNDYSLSFVLQPHFFLTVGKSFVISENFLISPSVMIKSISGYATADFNLNFFLKKRIWVGAFLRNDYGLGALFQVLLTKQFKLGYSFDSGFGGTRIFGSSHEIMLGFDFGTSKAKAVSPRFL